MHYDEIPFDRSTIEQDKLDVLARKRTNALSWRGQFTPDFVETLLRTYSPDGLVVDPYCGSGTTLMESAHAGLPSHGVEVNPAAYILARLYTLTEVSPPERLALLSSLQSKLSSVLSITESSSELAKWVVDLSDVRERYIMEAVFLQTLKNGAISDQSRLSKAWQATQDLVARLPQHQVNTTLELGDARNISLPDESASMFFTSPPYVNVFNYHQNYRTAVELLGSPVLPAARAEFGSNRKHRQNRFLTVIQYAQDIGLSLLESQRIAQPGALSIWVVGRESNVRGLPIANPQIVFEMATKGVGLEFVRKHERKFRSRYGALVFEDILVFRHPFLKAPTSLDDIAVVGRNVGTGMLESLQPTETHIRDEVHSAMSSAERIQPSPQPDHGTYFKNDLPV